MALHCSEGHTGDVNPTPHKTELLTSAISPIWLACGLPDLGSRGIPMHQPSLHPSCTRRIRADVSITALTLSQTWWMMPFRSREGMHPLPSCPVAGGPQSALFRGVSRAWEHSASLAQSYWVQKHAAANVCCFQDANLDLRAGCIPAMHNIFPFYVTTGWTLPFYSVKCATAHCYVCGSCPTTSCPPQRQQQWSKPQKVDMPKIGAPTWQSQGASHLFVMQKLCCRRLCEGDLGISIYVPANIHLCTCPCAQGQKILMGTVAYSLTTPSSVIQITHHFTILWFSLLYAPSFSGNLSKK